MPIVRTPRGPLVSGFGLHTADTTAEGRGPKIQGIPPYIRTHSWRHDLADCCPTVAAGVRKKGESSAGVSSHIARYRHVTARRRHAGTSRSSSLKPGRPIRRSRYPRSVCRYRRQQTAQHSGCAHYDVSADPAGRSRRLLFSQDYRWKVCGEMTRQHSRNAIVGGRLTRSAAAQHAQRRFHEQLQIRSTGSWRSAYQRVHPDPNLQNRSRCGHFHWPTWHWVRPGFPPPVSRTARLCPARRTSIAIGGRGPTSSTTISARRRDVEQLAVARRC